MFHLPHLGGSLAALRSREVSVRVVITVRHHGHRKGRRPLHASSEIRNLIAPFEPNKLGSRRAHQRAVRTTVLHIAGWVHTWGCRGGCSLLVECITRTSAT